MLWRFLTSKSINKLYYDYSLNSNNTFRNVGLSWFCSLQHHLFSVPQKVPVGFDLQPEFFLPADFRSTSAEPHPKLHPCNILSLFCCSLCNQKYDIPSRRQPEAELQQLLFLLYYRRTDVTDLLGRRLPLQLLKHSRILAAKKVICSAHRWILSIVVITAN